MKMVTVLFVAILSLTSLYSRGECAVECDDSDEVLADICYKLYKQVENALVADKGNIYRLRKAFFYAPNANPVLLKVVYNVSYSENVTRDATQLSYCSSDTTANNDSIMLNKTRPPFILGWTSSGVFTLFHPLTINFMQIQLPFAMMRIMFSIFRISNPDDSGPEAKTLLWDGSYDLPTLYINLHLTSLPCIPSEQLFHSILNDFNSLVRIYAGQDFTGIIQDSGNTHFVGFSLPQYKVLPINNVSAVSDFWFYVVYVMSTIILYATCVTTIFFVVSNSDQQGLRSFTDQHPEVLKGITIVISAFILLEVIAEFVMAVVWTVHVHDPLVGFTIFLAAIVYYSPGFISLFKIGKKIYRHDTHTLFECFVWTTSYFLYILLYSFFPAFVLAFAYPTRVITIFVFIATFMILSVVYLTTYMHKGLTIQFCTRFCSGRHQFMLKTVIWCVMSLFMIYFFLFVFALLYSLIIGKASVVTSAPLAILSLLPSIIISITAWLLKSTMLENSNADYETVDHETEPNNAQTNSEIQEVAATTIRLEESDDQNEAANSEHIPLVEQPILRQRKNSPTSDIETVTVSTKI